jgi:hypothetical protein
MSRANLSHVTRWGWPGIDRVPFAAHACDVRSSRNQLVASLALPKSLEEQVRSRL